MKSKQDIETIKSTSQFTYVVLRNQMKEDIALLEKIVIHDFMSKLSPENTVTAYVDKIGKWRAKTVIASLVNGCSYDGRISKVNATWASCLDESFDESAMSMMGLFSDKIHRSHLDQIADVMRRMDG